MRNQQSTGVAAVSAPHALERRLGTVDAALIIVGIVIGSGIFILPNVIAQALPSSAAILSVWIVSGVLSYFGALAYAELGAMMPETGGQYVFLREAYGPLCAFVCGWTFMLVVIAGGTAFLAAGFAIYLEHFIPLSPLASKSASIALVLLLSALNYVGVREGVWVQRIFTSLKIGGILFLAASAFLLPSIRQASTAASAPGISIDQFGVAMLACLLAYNGWTYISFVAGEVRNPGRNLPRSLSLAMLIVMALYVLANVAYLRLLTIAEIAQSERVGATLATRTLGVAGGNILSLIILASIIGAINGCILTGARIPMAQAQDGLFFPAFTRIHPRFKTPAFAIAIQAVWTSVLIISGSYKTLVSYAILAAWIFYTLSVAAVFVLRRKYPDAPRPYRMWGYPYSLLLFVAVSLWFIANSFFTQPVPSFLALLIAATGVPAYAIWRKSAKFSSLYSR